MTPKPAGTAGAQPTSPAATGLRLYIADGAPNSTRAIANLQSLRERCGQSGCAPELVDVVDEPLRALNDGILVTPTLVRFAPLPEVRIVGDLSDWHRVAQALGWMEAGREA